MIKRFYCKIIVGLWPYILPIDRYSYKLLKMQLDIGSEPYLSIAQALCLLISHTPFYISFATWQKITAMAKSTPSYNS